MTMNNDFFNQVLIDNSDYISVIAHTYQKNKIKFFGKCNLSQDEIEQNIRIAVWKALPKYKTTGGMSIKSFIWQAAYWELNREYKQINRPMPEQKEKSVNILENIEVRDCVNSLPEKYRNVLIKYCVEGKTLQEIGKEEGRTAECIRGWKNQAIELFRQKWEKL